MSHRTVAAVLVLMLAAGCSDDDAGGATTDTVPATPDVTICDPTGTGQSADELPDVATISEAIAAVEAALGGPTEFFEINTTARVVNLFVALNDGTVVQPWLYVDGELTTEDGQAASGGTFASSDVDFDADSVLDGVRAELPDATLETFYVHGDGQGNVRYGLLVSTKCGGGFDVIVGPDGTVQAVDPV
ncbi:MAG TPA: hypothetical protein VMS14_07925 [Ilumatobacteraceae bacterium]|nr:hypothetical protein [Ilumatobacteraceae bacterium]